MRRFKAGSVIAEIFIELISNATSADTVSTNVMSSIKSKIRNACPSVWRQPKNP